MDNSLPNPLLKENPDNMKKENYESNVQFNKQTSVGSEEKSKNTSIEVPIHQPTQNATICHCCLELECQKSLWHTYEWMGSFEKYGAMLQECFSLDLSDQESAKICEVCITQLRNAMRFRVQVVRCQARLRNRQDANLKPTAITKNLIKIEKEVDDSGELEMYCEDRIPLTKSESGSDEEICTKIETSNDGIKSAAEVNPRSLKRLTLNKRKKGRKRIIQIKKSSNIDRRTIAFQSSKFTKPRRNVSLLLEHSTICPFKYSKAYFKCFYCSKNFLVFEELRSHVKESHDDVRFIDIIKCITRPHDQVKADVSEISCRMCHKRCNNLDELMTHLSDMHSVTFVENSVDSIIGYELGDNKFKCAVCKEEFLFFKTLAKHMNEHSSRHVCDVCGKCFLLIERLRAHVQMHAVHAIKCESCEKVFPTKQALKSHISYTHERKPYPCSICNEMFPTYRKRLQHFVERHGRPPLSLHCEHCEKTFTSNSNLSYHVKYTHLKVPREAKFTCEDCGRKFKTKRVLTGHMVVHSGEKNYECDVCKKKFGRLNSLKEHLKIHRNDKRWSCGACAVCFVQKCSLKNHIRVHHAEYNLGDLIIYKNPNK